MARLRFVYRKNEETGEVESFQVSEDFTGAERRAQTATEELTYGGLQATDGTAINTRKRHREYMKENDLALHQDFAGARAEAAKQREAMANLTWTDSTMREDIGRAAHEVKSRRGRR